VIKATLETESRLNGFIAREDLSITCLKAGVKWADVYVGIFVLIRVDSWFANEDE
jgi:hypothetical protein